ncbi:hypothetical protein LCGC14_2207630 [marine sediment metagenome]|uniref:Uncharacterized protein n=1 Tax=marine sediment metagenome TaxID=412755 RepID=A0A0F9E272_9ZZZZ
MNRRYLIFVSWFVVHGVAFSLVEQFAEYKYAVAYMLCIIAAGIMMIYFHIDQN